MINISKIDQSVLYANLINRTCCRKNRALLASLYCSENTDGETIGVYLDELKNNGADFDEHLVDQHFRGYKI